MSRFDVFHRCLRLHHAIVSNSHSLDIDYYIPICPIPARFTQLGTNGVTDCCHLLHLTSALISSLCDSDTRWREEKIQPCLKTHYIIVTVALSPGKCLRHCLYSVAAEHSSIVCFETMPTAESWLFN